MHRIGEIPNDCKCLWIQVGAELAGVQLLFLGSSSPSSPRDVPFQAVPSVLARPAPTLLDFFGFHRVPVIASTQKNRRLILRSLLGRQKMSVRISLGLPRPWSC